jgi:anhydro-N-acetylmuramic acid kinase
MENTGKMRVLGVMSGTSLDGLDLALCEFEPTGNSWRYCVLKAKTINYPMLWKDFLGRASTMKLDHYLAISNSYGSYIADEINAFLKGSEHPDAIASHGHTVFHQPSPANTPFTAQFGNGAVIAAETGITTVCDFRSLDVANGGQGAPLVPVGDKFLFSQYESCLNIGGIANISYDLGGERIAYDICYANMLLNYLAEKLGKPYDDGGRIAITGRINEVLLKELFESYLVQNKRSLAREGFEKNLLPLLTKYEIQVEDIMASACEYIAKTVARELNDNKIATALVSGGGAYNSFLIDRLKHHFKGEVIIPDDNTIQFKEALIFAFLGYLRLNNKINTLKSVTGAKSDSVGGAVYLASC